VRPKSPMKSKEKCWNCKNVRHFKRGCKEEKKKNKKGNNDSDDESQKYSQEDGGYSLVVALETHVGQSAWLIDSVSSFHMTSHRHHFFSVEKYDGGMVCLDDDSPLNIIGRGIFLIKFPDGRVMGIHGFFVLWV